MKKAITVFLAALVFSHAHADQARIAVAANFMGPAQKLAEQFERESGHRIVTISGSTGKFYSQIRAGAPFDALLSADDETPARLEKEGAGMAGSRFTYAIGKLALWSARPDAVDDKGAVLSKGSYARLALANPKLAPYGAAAMETLAALGLKEQVQPKLIYGENIAQAHQFVASGNAELGFVALSQIYRDGKLICGSAWIVPNALHAPIRQDAVLLAHGRDNKAAVTFLAYLKTPAAQAVIRSFGYDF